MKILGIIDVVIGGLGVLASGCMFGDIGVACFIGSLSALFGGIGMIVADKRMKQI